VNKDPVSTAHLSRYGPLLGLGLTVLAIILMFTGFLAPLERMSWDLRFTMRGTVQPVDDVVLVTIDEKSVREFGRKISQWPRSYYAEAIRRLTVEGADLIVMDLDFSKPSAGLTGEDEDLAGAIYDSANVVLTRYISQGQAVTPLEAFRAGQVGEGFINYLPEPDGILRRVPLISLQVSEDLGEVVPYLSLPLEVARLYLFPGESPPVDLGHEDLFVMSDLKIPYPGGRMAVNYAGPPGTFQAVSFSDLMAENFKPDLFSGKIVLVGNTHPAYHDYFFTPFRAARTVPAGFEAREVLKDYSEGMSGVEVLANAVHTISTGSYIKTPSSGITAIWLLFVGLGGTFLFIHLNMGSIKSILIYLAVAAALFVTAYILFVRGNIMLDLISVEAVLSMTFLGGVVWHRYLNAMEKARITRTFGMYVSHQVVDRLIKHPELVRLGGEKKEMSVLFCDVRGFTSVSEQLDPEEVVRLLNQFLTSMTNVVFDHEGVVDKYMGDAIMAFYGAPIELKEHAEKACLTALEMGEALLDLQEKWRDAGIPVMEMGIGINSGPMVVGNMGSAMRFDYTVMGDSVNLGARLEGLNKLYGTRIIISEFTKNMINKDLLFRELDLVKVKGKQEPVRIYELMPTGSNQAPGLLELYSQGLAAYRQLSLERAMELFGEVLSLKPADGPATLYLNRCRELIKTPPPAQWDGVVIMDSK